MNIPLTPEQRRIIVEDYLDGEPLRVIKAEAGVGSNKTIYYVLRMHGIEPIRRPHMRRKVRTPVLTPFTFEADETTTRILNAVSPDNLSRYICNCLKRFLPKNY